MFMECFTGCVGKKRKRVTRKDTQISERLPSNNSNDSDSSFEIQNSPVAATNKTDKKSRVQAQPARKRKAYIPKSVKVAIWNRYIGEEIGKARCPVCSNNFITQMNFHCGHIVAESMGGKTTVDNLVPVCATCNLSMGTMNLHEFRQKYFESKIPLGSNYAPAS